MQLFVAFLEIMILYNAQQVMTIASNNQCTEIHNTKTIYNFLHGIKHLKCQYKALNTLCFSLVSNFDKVTLMN